MKTFCPSRVSDPRSEGQLVEIVICFRLNVLQFKHHFFVLALKVFVLLLSNDFSHCRSIQEGLNFTQLLKGRGMLLLKLIQILLEDGVILLELDMLNSQGHKLFRVFSKFSFCPLSSHGSIRGLTFHHNRVLGKDSELFLHLCHSLLELGVLLLDFFKPLCRGSNLLDRRDLSKVAIYKQTLEKTLYLRRSITLKRSYSERKREISTRTLTKNWKDSISSAMPRA